MNILKNKSTITQKNVVIANSGLAISTALNKTLDYGLEKAKESIESGAALNSFKSLKNVAYEHFRKDHKKRNELLHQRSVKSYGDLEKHENFNRKTNSA